MCISTSFWVLRAPKSWSNYFFSAVFNLFCSFQTFFSDFIDEINKKRLKMNKKNCTKFCRYTTLETTQPHKLLARSCKIGNIHLFLLWLKMFLYLKSLYLKNATTISTFCSSFYFNEIWSCNIYINHIQTLLA